jgi:hypothetical protein
MNAARMSVVLGPLFLLALSGCERPPTPAGIPTNVEAPGSDLQVSGPHAHKNLTVFLVHADKQDERDFLTLDEGLPKGLVKISELEQERVNALQIDNRSDRPLYLQEGERLSGGKQDRIIITSLVIPPHSGPTPAPTFCIEQSRWREGLSGKSFGFTANGALAPKGVRGAAKVESAQDGVWECVHGQKVTAVSTFKAPNTNSSGNEMLDAPQVQKISDEYAAGLAAALEKQPDAVGVAVVINGHIEEVNVYPNHALLRKFYPRLIGSYAVQAAMLKDQAKTAKPPTPADVVRFMQEGDEKSKEEKTVSNGNATCIRELTGNKFECTTRFKDQVIHWQMLKKNGIDGGGERNARLGSKW